MKAQILAVIVAVALIVPAKAFHCRVEPDMCDEGTCCVEFGVFSKCRNMLKEGDQCELTPIKSKLHDHVYLMHCPCGEGLTCEEDDSGSLIRGKCVSV